KITNFRRAVIYWDVAKNNITFLPCLPLPGQQSSSASASAASQPEASCFQAPECYGDPAKEAFDPIIADTWSYGAVLFFMAAASSSSSASASGSAKNKQPKQPYDPTKTSKDLEAEVQTAV